jgi:hypothetical protein
VPKSSFLLIVPLLLWFNSLLLDSEKIREKSCFLESNPFILRAVSPLNGSFVADYLWLKSSLIDEISGEVDKDKLYQLYQTVILLDPEFTTATEYGAIYFANQLDDIESALFLLQFNREFNREDSGLLLLEIVIRVAYGESSREELLSLSERLLQITEGRDLTIGRIELNSFIDDIISYLQDESVRNDIIEGDRELLNTLKK